MFRGLLEDSFKDSMAIRVLDDGIRGMEGFIEGGYC